MKKKSKKELSEDTTLLQQVLIEKMTDRLLSPDCTASDIANVRQFMKDNGFVIDPVRENDALDGILEAIEKKKSSKFPTIGEQPS